MPVSRVFFTYPSGYPVKEHPSTFHLQNIHIYIYIHIERDRETDRQREAETSRKRKTPFPEFFFKCKHVNM
jgi:hypothetical protein